MSEPLEQQEKKHLLAMDGINSISLQTKSVGGVNLVEFLSNPENKDAFKFKKIIVAGPPHSGKTIFNKGIKETIKSIPNAPYPLVHSACPDGEGSWFLEAMNNDPVMAAKLKAEYKKKFTPEFVKLQVEQVKTLGSESNPLNFIDIGGMTTPENFQICGGANAAIILCGETAIQANLATEWKEFFNNLGIPVIAELYSDYFGNEDLVVGVEDDGVFRGSIHHLERLDIKELKNRPTIKALSDHILNFEKRNYRMESIINKVNSLIIQWQKLLPEVDIILDQNTEFVGINLQFLVKENISDEDMQKLIEKIEIITGLKKVKEGANITGRLQLKGVEIPLDVNGYLIRKN